MRLLFLTNFYPPASHGGYKQWCQEVADGLRNRGHEVLVLTSTDGRKSLQSPDPIWVRRELHTEMEFASLRKRHQFFTRRITNDQEKSKQVREYFFSAIKHQPKFILNRVGVGFTLRSFLGARLIHRIKRFMRKSQ